ncbi:protein shisa-like-1 [Terrapene carolina triunguis]|uniref:protein shisa-like-1 n=1 Tax=Terrapene triunguis TaxID=2587831 RepID=UPI000E77D020|nr:protein shisa-like-1 [Terrapene carolina triunguis]
MLHRLLLAGLLSTTLPTSFLGTASARNLHLCEGYPSADGRYHSGFYCPRLTDPPAHRYCCRHGDHALKSCCPQLEFESLRRVNLSNVPTPARLRNPLPLLAVGLYGLLVLTLMTLDFLHFCRLNQRRFYSLLSSSRLGKSLASSFPHRRPRPGPARGGTQRQEPPTARPSARRDPAAGAAHGPAQREEGPSSRSRPRPGPARGGTQRQELPTARPSARRDPAAGAPHGPAQREERPSGRSRPRPGPGAAGQLRQEGNRLFQAGDYAAALASYTRALALCAGPPERAVLHRNRAACHLKLPSKPMGMT